MNKWKNKWIDYLTHEWVNECMNERMNQLPTQWMNEWMLDRTKGRSQEQLANREEGDNAKHTPISFRSKLAVQGSRRGVWPSVGYLKLPVLLLFLFLSLFSLFSFFPFNRFFSPYLNPDGPANQPTTNHPTSHSTNHEAASNLTYFGGKRTDRPGAIKQYIKRNLPIV